jgi:competence protein ComEA
MQTPSAKPPSGNGHAPALAADPAPPAAADNTLVDLNTAGPDDLRQLRGIGPALAERIVQYRAAVGAFKTPEDLLLVPGISQATLEANRARLVARAGAAEIKPPAEPAPMPAIASPATELAAESRASGPEGVATALPPAPAALADEAAVITPEAAPTPVVAAPVAAAPEPPTAARLSPPPAPPPPEPPRTVFMPPPAATAAPPPVAAGASRHTSAIGPG